MHDNNYYIQFFIQIYSILKRAKSELPMDQPNPYIYNKGPTQHISVHKRSDPTQMINEPIMTRPGPLCGRADFNLTRSVIHSYMRHQLYLRKFNFFLIYAEIVEYLNQISHVTFTIFQSQSSMNL